MPSQFLTFARSCTYKRILYATSSTQITHGFVKPTPASLMPADSPSYFFSFLESVASCPTRTRRMLIKDVRQD